MSSWNKIATEEMKPFGLRGGAVIYLIALYKHQDGITSAKICEICNRDKAEVSRTISAMEKKGLVSRKSTTVNGYNANITLTDKGKEVTKTLRDRVKLAVERGGEGLTDKQREEFYNALKVIGGNLKRISREGL